MVCSRVTPGSVIITKRLEELGLLAVYKEAGFSIGVPGCSFCLGIAADVAGVDEVWLSSQNRNYRNRMGKGSIANLASAVTVAASSFDMEITDPMPLIQQIDQEAFRKMISKGPSIPITISEPEPEIVQEESFNMDMTNNPAVETPKVITGRAQVFGDNIDTDAILPGEYLCENDVEKLGKVAFIHTNPDFREKVLEGQNIVVGGHGFGCGSSREQAVTCLNGAGVKAVIARSFGYIFSRNYQNFNLLGIQLQDDAFYKAVQDNTEITIRMTGRTIHVGDASFPFQMSLFEERLLAGGGIMPLYKAFGNKLFRVAVSSNEEEKPGCKSSCDTKTTTGDTNW